MNRRDILKGLGALPFAAAIRGYSQDQHSTSESREGIQSVQVLLEGAFTLVFESKPKRLIAFIPQDKTGRLGHKVYFNDPVNPLGKGPFRFMLEQEGLRSYEQSYVNPGFKDIEAHTDVWNRGPELITLELPFPDSVNFSGRPLNIRFQDKRQGMMPTSYILGYYTKPGGKARLSCPELGRECTSSPHCPPGTTRYFFGASPDMGHMGHDDKKHEKRDEPCEKEVRHAIDFFNEVILPQFPKLQKRLALSYIEKGPLCGDEHEKRSAIGLERTDGAMLRSAVFSPEINEPRLLRVADVIDCQVIGPVIFRP